MNGGLEREQVLVAHIALAEVRGRGVDAALVRPVHREVLGVSRTPCPWRADGPSPGSRGSRPRRGARPGTGPRRRSPRCGPSAGRARGRAPATAPSACRGRALRARPRSSRARRASGSHDDASPIGIGKCVPFGAARPWSASSWVITGMPRRVLLFTQLCRSFRNVGALARTPRDRPLGDVGFTSLGREIWPIPWGIASLACSGTKRPSASAILSLFQKAVSLGDLLLERHAREQVLHPLVDRERRIAIAGGLGRRAERRGQDRGDEREAAQVAALEVEHGAAFYVDRRLQSREEPPMNLARPQATEFAPFYAGYVARVPEDDVLSVLLKQQDEIRQLARALPAAREGFRYARGQVEHPRGARAPDRRRARLRLPGVLLQPRRAGAAAELRREPVRRRRPAPTASPLAELGDEFASVRARTWRSCAG